MDECECVYFLVDEAAKYHLEGEKRKDPAPKMNTRHPQNRFLDQRERERERERESQCEGITQQRVCVLERERERERERGEGERGVDKWRYSSLYSHGYSGCFKWESNSHCMHWRSDVTFGPGPPDLPIARCQIQVFGEGEEKRGTKMSVPVADSPVGLHRLFPRKRGRGNKTKNKKMERGERRHEFSW